MNTPLWVTDDEIGGDVNGDLYMVHQPNLMVVGWAVHLPFVLSERSEGGRDRRECNFEPEIKQGSLEDSTKLHAGMEAT